jgi:hypothetical protein
MLFYFLGLSIGYQIGKYGERDKNYYHNYIQMREKVQVLENKLIKMNHDCTIKQTTNTNETNTNETNTNETYYKDDT